MPSKSYYSNKIITRVVLLILELASVTYMHGSSIMEETVEVALG